MYQTNKIRKINKSELFSFYFLKYSNGQSFRKIFQIDYSNLFVILNSRMVRKWLESPLLDNGTLKDTLTKILKFSNSTKH